MKLCYSPTSPYVRKVVVTAMETGLEPGIERIANNVWDPATDIAATNPLGKVPALTTDDGAVLFDSPVICEYLDSLHDGAKLFPAVGPARWRALRQQALCDGILDAGILRMLEGRLREEGMRSQMWMDRQAAAVGRALVVLEDEATSLDGDLTIGHIAVGCTLGYLDFRYADDNWRGDCPALADWYEGFAERPSMMATIPKDPS